MYILTWQASTYQRIDVYLPRTPPRLFALSVADVRPPPRCRFSLSATVHRIAEYNRCGDGGVSSIRGNSQEGRFEQPAGTTVRPPTWMDHVVPCCLLPGLPNQVILGCLPRAFARAFAAPSIVVINGDAALCSYRRRAKKRRVGIRQPYIRHGRSTTGKWFSPHPFVS